MSEIKQYTQEDCIAINQFMENYFPNRPEAIIKRSRTDTYFNWKYGPNPFGKAIMFTYWEDIELLGTFGAIPAPLSVRGNKILAYQLTDAFVAPKMHGKGIFGQLANLVYEEIDKRSDICFGLGPSAYSLPIFTKKYNMYTAPTYRQVFSPIRFDDILRAKHFNFISPIGHLFNIIRNNLFPKSAIDIEEINDLDYSSSDTPTDEADFCIIRDQQYLTYRYIRCPEHYRYFSVRDSNNAVVLVVKFIEWQNMKICYLIDVIGKQNLEVGISFLCQALYLIGLKNSAGMVSIELHNPTKELNKLKRMGFICHRREECLFMRQNKWPFLNPTSADYDSKKWIIFSGDSDYI